MVTIVGYVLSFYGLSVTLKTLPVGIVYAIWSGLGIVALSLIGKIAFGQTLDGWAWCGIAFIVVGVLIIRLLSSSVSP
jgi:multidrug transporter EmrE-like cation transporter